MPVNKLKIIYRDPAALVADARNARVHSDDQVDEIVASIQRFGFTNPILLRDDDVTIGAGHGRQSAALRMGLANVPTITLKGLTEDEWRAYAIADNKLALNATWDEKLLLDELAQLKAIDADLAGLTGFSDAEVEAILNPPAAPGAPSQARTVTFTYKEQFGVIVVCKSEAEQKALFERLQAEGLDVKVVVT